MTYGKERERDLARQVKVVVPEGLKEAREQRYEHSVETAPEPLTLRDRVAANIRRCREERGITQRKAAKISGILQVCWSTYETGRSVPGIENLEKICKALGVTGRDVLGF